MNTINILLTGGVGVGKTAFLERIMSGKFVETYIPTHHDTKYDTLYNTNVGMIEVAFTEAPENSWKTKTSDDFQGFDGFIYMMDVTNPDSFNSLNEFVEKVPPQTPIVCCGNKFDLRHRVSARSIYTLLHNRFTFFYVSAKSLYDFEKPVLTILRRHYHNNTIHFKMCEV